VSGEVIEVNKAVVDNPGLVNTEPYTSGWFYKIRLSNSSEVSSLLGPEQYKAQISGG
jgi:glycine cleavage system H protein